MEFSALFIALIVNLIISIGIPLGCLIYLIKKRRENLKPFFIGSAVFLISQIFLRLPIIQVVLPNFFWFNSMMALEPILFSIFLGVTAGVFEEVGRYLGFKFALKNNREFNDGLACGLGHGGIEAILITGLANINSLILLVAIQNGTLGSNEIQVKAIFENTTFLMAIMGGLERIFAMSIHVGLTILVLYSIKLTKKKYLFLAIVIHSIIDSGLGVFKALGASVFQLELWCGLSALVLIIYTIKSRNKFKNMGSVENYEKGN